MQIKHFKKTFIMNNKWARTCKALKGLLDILICSKCNKSLHDPQQFLGCGHFSCISCINNNNTTCNECQLPSGSKNTITDSTIEKIIQHCYAIATEVGFRQNIENIETRPNQELQLDNTKNHIVTTPNNLPKKPEVKLNKRKGSVYLINGPRSKKGKFNKLVPVLRIPKNINKRNHHGETKLLEECKRNHIENVKQLLKAGADPNIGCNASWTPLQESADFDYYEIVKILLKSKADVNQPGCDDRTALHEAAKNNNINMIKLLLNHHAKKDASDKNGKKPIDCCQSKEIKELLKSNNPENTNETSIKTPCNIISPKDNKKIVITESISNYKEDDEQASSSRRITRNSVCGDNNAEIVESKSISECAESTNQSSVSRRITRKNISLENNEETVKRKSISENKKDDNLSCSPRRITRNSVCGDNDTEIVRNKGISECTETSHKPSIFRRITRNNISLENNEETASKKSTSEYILDDSQASNPKRTSRTSVCGDNNTDTVKNKSISEYAENINQPSCSRKIARVSVNQEDYNENGENNIDTVKNKSISKYSENINQSSCLRKITRVSVIQVDNNENGENNGISELSENNDYGSDLKRYPNHRISQRNEEKKSFNFEHDFMNDDDSDSDIECVAIVQCAIIQKSIGTVKREGDDLNNAINCRSSQESIDVVNTSRSQKLTFNGNYSQDAKIIHKDENNSCVTSQNTANSNFNIESEEIIDIMN